MPQLSRYPRAMGERAFRFCSWIQRIVVCSSVEGIALEDLASEVEVVGILSINEQQRDGFMMIPCHLEATSVRRLEVETKAANLLGEP